MSNEHRRVIDLFLSNVLGRAVSRKTDARGTTIEIHPRSNRGSTPSWETYSTHGADLRALVGEKDIVYVIQGGSVIERRDSQSRAGTEQSLSLKSHR